VQPRAPRGGAHRLFGRAPREAGATGRRRAPGLVTDDAAAARRTVDEAEAFALALPSYRDAFAPRRVKRPSDIALIGTEDAVVEKAAAFEAAGATHLVAVLHAGGDNDRMLELLGSLADDRRDNASPALSKTEPVATHPSPPAPEPRS
jgi:hypothetical protein